MYVLCNYIIFRTDPLKLMVFGQRNWKIQMQIERKIGRDKKEKIERDKIIIILTKRLTKIKFLLSLSIVKIENYFLKIPALKNDFLPRTLKTNY